MRKVVLIIGCFCSCSGLGTGELRRAPPAAGFGTRTVGRNALFHRTGIWREPVQRLLRQRPSQLQLRVGRPIALDSGWLLWP